MGTGAGAHVPSHHTLQVPPGQVPWLWVPAVALGTRAALKLRPLRCNDPSQVGKWRHPFSLFFLEQPLLQEEHM